MINFFLGFLLCLSIFLVIAIILIAKFIKIPAVIRSGVVKDLKHKDNDIEKWF